MEAVLDAGPNVWKFVVTHPDAGRLAAWYAEAEAVPAYGVEYSWHDRIDVMPAGRSKGSRLLAWAAERGIDPADIVAFGDNFNDLAMLTGVGLGIAMGNAPDTVKAQAREIIGTNDTDAIADRVETLLA
jgi:hydroxymethylpyrimidine pyrophosphatase-like HAD family hydrolase